MHVPCKPRKEEHDLCQTAHRLGELGSARALGFLVNKRGTLEKARVCEATVRQRSHLLCRKRKECLGVSKQDLAPSIQDGRAIFVISVS